MKLAIIVVYLLSEENERLFDIHLEKIQNNTTSPFTIYAGINLLLPQFVNKLDKYDFVKICDCQDYKGPDEDNRGTKEQSHYVEQIINRAIKDGVSHIVIMHPDSFPIKLGWDIYLEKKLSDSCVLVSNFPAMSGCTFFNRDFYLKYQPRLLPSIEEKVSTSWKNFQKTNRATNLVETGMGYGYKAYLENLTWYKLKRSNRGEYHNYYGSIFEDVVFHLGSASEYNNRLMRNYAKDSIYNQIKQYILNLLPISIKKKIKSTLPDKILYPEVKKNKSDFLKVRKSLFNETEEFLNFLRIGNKIN